MKTFHFSNKPAPRAWLFVLLLPALVIANCAIALPVAATAYTEVSRGPHSRVMQRTVTFTNAAGRTITQIHSYTELATGMSVLQNGVWTPSSNQIQITPSGAECTNCQHSVFFKADLLASNAVDLITPEGFHMTSSLAALAYYDGTTNVIIATPQDSVGQLIAPLDRVIYTNAFSGVDADVLYKNSKSGFDQSIIFRAQPPPPSAFGLTSSNIWIQIWTEFSAPTPQISEPQNGGDETLDFGIMKMAGGTAFSLSDPSNSVPVIKRWGSSGGRTFLIESTPLSALAAQLSQLPAPSGSNPSSGSSGPLGRTQSRVYSRQPSPGPLPQQPFGKITLPARKPAKEAPSAMRIISHEPNSNGLLLDYSAINGSMTNVTLQSDTTYFTSSTVNLYGTTTLEGGAIIKNGQPIGDAIFVYGTFLCHTAPYRPAILTCTNDDTVGEQLPGSSGIPAVIAGGCHLYLENSGTISNVFFRYGWNSLVSQAPDMEVWDCQFFDCMNSVTVQSYNTNVGLHNVLMTMDNAIDNTTNYCGCYTGGILFTTGSPASLYCEHLTANVQSQNYMSFAPFGTDPTGATITLTNSIVVAPFLIPGYQNGSSSGASITTNSVYYASTLPGDLFQTVGAGNYYLADDSPYRNAGTTNISPALLAELQQKTTYPPIVFNGGTGTYYTSGSTTFYPQAQRESGDAPDIGYGYDPVDFTFGGIYLTNATFNVEPGTVLAALVTNGGTFGLTIGFGGQFLCQGTPNSLSRFVNFNTVQEEWSTNWVTPSVGVVLANYSDTGPNSVINCRFTDFSILAQDTSHIFCEGGSNDPVNLQDCQFHGGVIYSGYSTVNLTNCLLERVAVEINTDDGVVPLVRNNLFYGGVFDFIPGVTNAVIQDNVFFQTDVTHSGTVYNGGFNAFLTNCTRVLPTNATDFVLTNIAFQAGPLGFYYYPTNSPLINADTNTTADQVGLFHYTTTTNQVPETNSFLDLGFHFIALGTNGLPLDSSGSGTPDYLRDANGNGLVDSGELSWTNAADLGLNVIITRPANNSTIP